MKTNKFENTIRRKLESIEPDFQEQDWARMQRYMQAHTPPSFLQQYGSWIGYAAAASVTSVMAYMYVNQLSQNNNLVRDVKNLQSQIELIRNQPAVTKTDTVYMLRSMPDGKGLTVAETNRAHYLPDEKLRVEPGDAVESGKTGGGEVVYEEIEKLTPIPDNGNATNLPQESYKPGSNSNAEIVGPKSGSAERLAANESYGQSQNGLSGTSTMDMPASPARGKTFNGNFEVASIDNPLEWNAGLALKRKMNYELASKLSSRQVQKALVANHIQIAQIPKAPVRKPEQVAQTESVVPKLPLKTPYRFGAGYQLEGNGQGKTVMGEVIVKKKFSISAGITWLKVKPAEFFTETIFREKSRQDFKETHPGQVPLIFKVYNIKIDQSVVQMPLTLAFRNTVKDDWAYYGSMGANIRLSSKETVSFDCRGPKNEFFNQTFEKKADVSAVTSMNFAVGIEKSWHPIIVQAEGYWVNYFKPVTPLRHSAGPGLKVKLLYQIGRQM